MRLQKQWEIHRSAVIALPPSRRRGTAVDQRPQSATGQAVRALFSYAEFDYQLPPGARVTDVTEGKIVETSGILKTECCHTWELRFRQQRLERIRRAKAALQAEASNGWPQSNQCVARGILRIAGKHMDNAGGKDRNEKCW